MIRRWHRFQVRVVEMLDWKGEIDGRDMMFLLVTHLVGLALGFVSGSAVALVCASLTYILTVFGKQWVKHYRHLQTRSSEAMFSTAIHESGHAIVGYALGRTIRYANVAQMEGRYGVVSTTDPPTTPTPTGLLLVLHLSGLVAEHVIFGSCKPNLARSDRTRALAALRTTAEFGQGNEGFRILDQQLGSNPTIVRLDKDLKIEAFFPGESFTEAEKIIFQFAWKLAQFHIVRHEDILRSFAHELVDHLMLPGATIRARFAKVDPLMIPGKIEIYRIFKEPHHVRRPEPKLDPTRARNPEPA